MLLIYDRPDLTARCFDVIRRARPPQLFVVADGPRGDREGDLERCRKAQNAVGPVDWPCEVAWNVSDRNLGAARRVSSGLDWVFSHVDRAVILEDDCLAHLSFFRFCDDLLERYCDDERVMVISGNNFQFGRRVSRHSYYFSSLTHIWGWATWRRAWRCFDFEMAGWPEAVGTRIIERVWPGHPEIAAYWKDRFERTLAGEFDAWDYRWTFACWLRGGLTILPAVNLVSNLGFRPDATHTLDEASHVAALPAVDIGFPLEHPAGVRRSYGADVRTSRRVFGIESLLRRLAGRVAGKARSAARRLRRLGRP